MFKQTLKILQHFGRLFDHFVNKILKVILLLVLTKFTDQKTRKIPKYLTTLQSKKMHFIFHIATELIIVLIRCDVRTNIRRCVDGDATLGYSLFYKNTLCMIIKTQIVLKNKNKLRTKCSSDYVQ